MWTEMAEEKAKLELFPPKGGRQLILVRLSICGKLFNGLVTFSRSCDNAYAGLFSYATGNMHKHNLKKKKKKRFHFLFLD